MNSIKKPTLKKKSGKIAMKKKKLLNFRIQQNKYNEIFIKKLPYIQKFLLQLPDSSKFRKTCPLLSRKTTFLNWKVSVQNSHCSQRFQRTPAGPGTGFSVSTH